VDEARRQGARLQPLAFFALVPEPSIKTSVEAMSLAVLKTMAPK
jgi:hippurate hydrolase